MKLNKSKLNSSEVLFEKCGVPVGSPAKEMMEERALAWFYDEILRNRRKELEISQAELAERVGVKQSYIGRIERGETDIRLSSLIRIATKLGLSLELSV